MRKLSRAALISSFAAVLFGCTTEGAVEIKTVSSVSQGFMTGRVRDTPAQAGVLLSKRGDKLDVDVRWLGVCDRTEVLIRRRVEHRKTKVSATTLAISGVLAGTGAALYVWPDADVEASEIDGSVLLGAGAITFLAAASATGETKNDLPPEEVHRIAPPASCVIGPAGDESVVVRGSHADEPELAGKTNASGHVELDAVPREPIQVFVRGRRAKKVEWLR